MGIPSYYKKLLNELPHLVKRSHPDAAIDWFFMDFNCLIYHCLHAMPVYVETQRDAWENELIAHVVTYTRNVIRQVAPKQGVFLAIDGVVPMAKMRQQRLRRFKSVWLNTRLGNKGSWDTNAITPGTAFMKRLHSGLETMIKEHGRGTWRLSTSDVPGEGEHKIMAEWRTGHYKGNAAVYGLDADLIVLSLLGRRHLNGSAWLFREEVDKGSVQYDAGGEELFEWFSIDTLEDWLTQGAVNAEAARVFLLNYGCAMSILGNDFLPSSLGLKMRDDGHAELLRILQTLPLPLVYPSTGEISLEGLQGLFRMLSTHEARRIEKALDKKKWFARGASETGLGENNWPLAQQEEFVLWGREGLRVDWSGQYAAQLLQGEKKNRVVNEYLFGIQWIWSYYTGNMNDICFNWYYPFSLPPLWEWVRDALNVGTMPEFPGTVAVRATEIRPTEQLVLVLPLESWSLIPPCKEKRFPYYAPQFFPSEFSFESVGKRFFWECEARIPLPSVVELKETMNRV